MTLRKTIEVVTKLAESGVIGSYAIAGAVAALNYIQPMLTEDLDVLVSIDGFERRTSGLLLLGPIERALAERGYTERTDLGYMIESWPVQFLPVGSSLDEEEIWQMSNARKDYPDNTEIFARKAEGRRQRAAATFAEKLAALDELRDRVAPIVRAREVRRNPNRPSGSEQDRS